MGEWKKRIAMMTVAGMLTISSLTGCSGTMNNDAVVVTVGESKMPLGVANFYARMQQAQYETYYASLMGTTADEMWTRADGDDKTYEDTIKEGLIESLENLYLLEQHASEYGVEVTEEEKKVIEEAASKFDEDNALEDKEVVSGYEKYVKKVLQLSTIQSKMHTAMIADVDTNVSDEEAAQKSMKYVLFSYKTTAEDGSSTELNYGEKDKLKETVKTFAENLKNSEGKDIDAAASEAGLEVQTATFDADSTAVNTDLIKAVDALETAGDTTDMVETEDGLYVGKLTSLLDREATDKKKTEIVAQRQQDQYDSLLKKWRDATEIEVNERLWEKVDFKKQGVTIRESAKEYDDSSEKTEN